MWNILFVNSMLDEERDMFFSWLLEFDSLQEDQTSFFKEKILSKRELIFKINPSSFNFIKQMLLKLNQNSVNEVAVSEQAQRGPETNYISALENNVPGITVQRNSQGKVKSITHDLSETKQSEKKPEAAAGN